MDFRKYLRIRKLNWFQLSANIPVVELAGLYWISARGQRKSIEKCQHKKVDFVVVFLRFPYFIGPSFSCGIFFCKGGVTKFRFQENRKFCHTRVTQINYGWFLDLGENIRIYLRWLSPFLALSAIAETFKMYFSSNTLFKQWWNQIFLGRTEGKN